MSSSVAATAADAGGGILKSWVGGVQQSNPLSDGVYTYTYDTANRLVGVSGTGMVVSSAIMVSETG